MYTDEAKAVRCRNDVPLIGTVNAVVVKDTTVTANNRQRVWLADIFNMISLKSCNCALVSTITLVECSIRNTVA
jgi:hypothetical protein